MKKYPALFVGLLFFIAATAQKNKLVLDHEKIFTAKEIASLDSMLQQYRRSSGRIVLISTDTLDVSSAQYATNLVNQIVKGSTNKPYIFMLLLSRKKVMILASVNDKVKPFIKDRTLLEILLFLIRRRLPELFNCCIVPSFGKILVGGEMLRAKK